MVTSITATSAGFTNDGLIAAHNMLKEQKFYGLISFRYEHGHAVLMRTEQTIKPDGRGEPDYSNGTGLIPVEVPCG